MSKQPTPHHGTSITDKISTVINDNLPLDETQHPKVQTRFFYGFLISFIVIVIGVLGYSTSLNMIPEGDYDPIHVVKNGFEISATVENIDNPGIKLPRESERLKWHITVTNTNSTDKFFKIYTNVINSGDVTHKSESKHVKILSGEDYSTDVNVVLKNDGINIVNISAEPFGVRDDFMKGEIDYLNRYESKGFSQTFRTYSESDFQYILERATLFKFLGFIVIPFVILSVKHIRDIAENRGQ